MKRAVIIVLLGFLFAETRVSAATYNVFSIAALQSAIDSAVAGDVLVLADGTYTDNMTLTVSKSGVTVRPVTPGGAYLNNIVAINIGGNNITFSGFQFTSRIATGGTIITVSGNHNILTQLNFDGYSAQKYINLQGQYNEVSYCNFKNKPVTAQIGNLIHIAPNFSLPGYNKIGHCSFQDMPGAGGDNGNECIRISNGATSTYVSRTVVEFNYFNNTGMGDSEAISVKCRENVLRYNTFTNNQTAMMVFRNGDSNIAYGNFFIDAGGIRVKEANDTYCYNNYFERSGANGSQGSVLYVYYTANTTNILRNMNFLNNTFVECGTINFDTGATGNTWANNIFKKSSGDIFMGSALGIKWAGNQYSGTLGITIPLGMTSTDPQLVRNANGYYGLSSNSPAIDTSSTNYPVILDITNVDDDPSLLLDISGQSRPADAILKDVGCDEFGANGVLNRPLALSDVGPSYLGGPSIAPSVSLTAPANGASFLAPATVELAANASDINGTITAVDFYNGSTLLGSDTSEPYVYTWTNVTAGIYNLTARATDNDDAVSTSAVAAITVMNPTYMLTVINGSGGGTYTNGHVQSIQANGAAPGYAFSQWTGDTQYVASVTASNTTVTMPAQAVTVTATYIATEQYTTNAIPVPYSWLAGYGITNNQNAEVLLDPDGDGLTTEKEYIAGTVPTNAASCLRIAENPRNIIGWDTISGRIYNVYWSTNLMSGFQCLESNIPWTRSSFTNSTVAPRGFYKIDVRLE